MAEICCELHSKAARSLLACWQVAAVSSGCRPQAVWLAKNVTEASNDQCRSQGGAAPQLMWRTVRLGHVRPALKIRYSLAGQDTRLSPERPGLESRWRKLQKGTEDAQKVCREYPLSRVTNPLGLMFLMFLGFLPSSDFTAADGPPCPYANSAQHVFV